MTTILAVTGLTKRFRVRDGAAGHRLLTAVEGVDLELAAGKTLALVGESGSGKSTVARCITRLVEPDAGTVRLGDRDVTAMSGRALRAAYGEMQLVFQDPNSSLDPRQSVRAIVEEPLRLHTRADRTARRARVEALLADVRLDAELAERYPRQLSGGQRQRVGIARALAVDPTFLLLDEPTASLDVSVRRDVLRLLRRLRRERGLGFLLISHDLEAVRQMADEVAVMYLGKIIERGRAAEVFDAPAHPYTRALLSSAPTAEYGRRKQRLRLRGEIPSAVDLPRGCRLASRCPLAERSCHETYPADIPLSPTHTAACPVTTRAPVLTPARTGVG